MYNKNSNGDLLDIVDISTDNLNRITRENYERRIDKINDVLKTYGISSIEEAKKITDEAGVDVYNIVKGVQPICFENACWAYIVGAAIAIKKGDKAAKDVAKSLGECSPRGQSQTL